MSSTDDMKVKNAVRKRDGNRCQCCGNSVSMNANKQHDVHRLLPGYGYEKRWSVTLCRPCHAYIPKKVADLFETTNKGVFGVVIARICDQAEELIARIRKVVKEHDDEMKARNEEEFGVSFFGMTNHEFKTGEVPIRKIARENE